MRTLKLRDGQHLAYRTQGDGEPLLLIMGTGADHTFWGANVPALAERHRVIVYDSRGTGSSGDFARVEDGSAELLAEDAAELLEHAAGGRPAHVHGLSLGSVVAQELALRRPELVRSLGLHGTWCHSDGWFLHMVEGMELALRSGGLEAFIRCATTWILSPDFHHEQAELLRTMERAYVESDSPARVEGVLAHCRADRHVDTRERLEAVDVPALVTAGERDIQVPPRYGRATAERIRGSRFHLFEGPTASHCACFEMAGDFNRVVLDFTASLA
jgi:pimeloyl-ACP methyl ester carboxylesterase